ncbi:hypothetical protein BJV78DRAFT_1209932 [Lactifluus subvellereus]|nr:hypothetical protein BJV78DRAFT_1209932 [Lactifluus subvellereus]
MTQLLSLYQSYAMPSSCPHLGVDKSQADIKEYGCMLGGTTMDTRCFQIYFQCRGPLLFFVSYSERLSSLMSLYPTCCKIPFGFIKQLIHAVRGVRLYANIEIRTRRSRPGQIQEA